MQQVNRVGVAQHAERFHHAGQSVAGERGRCVPENFGGARVADAFEAAARVSAKMLVAQQGGQGRYGFPGAEFTELLASPGFVVKCGVGLQDFDEFARSFGICIGGGRAGSQQAGTRHQEKSKSCKHKLGLRIERGVRG